MKRLRWILVLLACWAWTGLVRADSLVLVHGYASSAATWDASGVTAVLAQRGWQRGGLWRATPRGPLWLPGPADPQAPRRYYLVDLPARAPLQWQANALGQALALLRAAHPEEPLILAGHSAGGVVARLVLLGGNPYRVDSLITIAAPHLGTIRAAEGLDLVDSKPFFCPGPGIDFLKTVLGGSGYRYLKHSRGLLLDLLPAGPGTLLYWANHQPYPDIHYYSVIRENGFSLGDELVPAYSQDMNNVLTLHGHSVRLTTASGHGLTPADGALLADILDHRLAAASAGTRTEAPGDE